MPKSEQFEYMPNEYAVTVIPTNNGGSNVVTSMGRVQALNGPVMSNTGINASLMKPGGAIVGATSNDDGTISMMDTEGNWYTSGTQT